VLSTTRKSCFRQSGTGVGTENRAAHIHGEALLRLAYNGV